jgi:hypothetical protein
MSFNSVERFLEMKPADTWACKTTPLHVSFMIFSARNIQTLNIARINECASLLKLKVMPIVIFIEFNFALIIYKDFGEIICM